MKVATYVYAVLANAPKKLGRAPAGLEGAEKPRLLAADGYSLLVATVPLPQYGAKAIEKQGHNDDWLGAVGTAHEAIVEHAASLGPVVPMSLFTLFASDEEALEQLGKRKKALARSFARIEGCSEWGIRIMAGPEGARETKKAARHLFAKLEKASNEAIRKRGAPEDVLLDGVFLVQEEGLEKFKKIVTKAAQTLADDGHHVMFSGPWPAYSFVDA